MADTSTAQLAQPSLLDKIGGFLASVGGIVDNGFKVYTSAVGRLSALEKLDQETSTTTKTALPAAALPPALALNKNNMLSIGAAVGLLVLGIILARRR